MAYSLSRVQHHAPTGHGVHEELPRWAGARCRGQRAGGSTAGVIVERHRRGTPATVLMGTVAGFDLTGFLGKYFK